jgi:uncharacterized protein with FMN-binding domain
MVSARTAARRALPVAVAAAAVGALLANVRPRPRPTAPPVRPALAAPADTAIVHGVSTKRPSRAGPVRTATGDVAVTPFSYMEVRVTLTGGELTRVETVELSGTGARTQAINARAEPILREEALRAGSADVDVVTGATYTSRSYLQSLQSAIDKARRRG